MPYTLKVSCFKVLYYFPKMVIRKKFTSGWGFRGYLIFYVHIWLNIVGFGGILSKSRKLSGNVSMYWIFCFIFMFHLDFLYNVLQRRKTNIWTSIKIHPNLFLPLNSWWVETNIILFFILKKPLVPILKHFLVCEGTHG